MRGVELPINVLIIIVIAIIVLVAITVMFSTGILIPKNIISAQAALDRACLDLQHDNCVKETRYVIVYDFDADNDGQLDPGSIINVDPEDNLYSLCVHHFQTYTEDECKKLCLC